MSDATVAIIPLPLVISGLVSNATSVVWSSTPGKNYQVLATTNLAAPFVAVSGIIPATALSSAYLDVSNLPPAGQRFYKVQVVP